MRNEADLARPFAPDLLKRARAIADRYRLILEPAEEGGFIGRALEFPSGFERGASADECVANVRQALTGAVATMLEIGQQPPRPSTPGTRGTQVNIRLSSEERLLLESSAQQAGFRGLSDFVRAAALRGVREPLTSTAARSQRRTPRRTSRS